MSQVEQRSTLSSIEQFHQKAIRATKQKNTGPKRSQDYQQVLAVDGSIKFAMDGRARAAARARTRPEAQRRRSPIPASLSSDAPLPKPSSLYQNAAKIADPGPRLTDQLKRLELLLPLASEPVAVDVDVRRGNGCDASRNSVRLENSVARRCSCVPAVTSSSAAATGIAMCVAN